MVTIIVYDLEYICPRYNSSPLLIVHFAASLLELLSACLVSGILVLGITRRPCNAFFTFLPSKPGV